MSDNNIPFEIQTEIIQRIPDTKSVIRCRSVSKAWKSVIDSKDFVTAHTFRHTQGKPHHLLIRTLDGSDKQVKYVSIIDDDTFPHRKLSVFVPDSVNRLFSLADSQIAGTSHGLFCLYNEKESSAVIWNPCIRRTVSIVIWKPCIRNTVSIAVPNKLGEWFYRTVVGFGICPRNLDPKLVKITCVYYYSMLQDVNASIQVEVFKVSSGETWRSPLSSNLPHRSIRFGRSQAVVDGFIYWSAVDSINVDDGFRKNNVIMSFDLTSEEFTKVNLPDPLVLFPNFLISLFNLRESLVVLVSPMFALWRSCDVWMMSGHGCIGSFNKLYSINIPDASMRKTLGFRKRGAPIIEVHEDREEYDFKTNSLAIYEPESKNITNIGIHGLTGTFFVHSYTETLLLLGH